MYFPPYAREELNDLVQKVQKLMPPGWIAGYQEDHHRMQCVFFLSHPDSGQNVSVHISAEELAEVRDVRIKEKITVALKERLSSKRLSNASPLQTNKQITIE